MNTNYGIYESDGGNQDITIQNNEILNATTGLRIEGNSGNAPNNGLVFQNTFGNPVDDLSLGFVGIETNYSDGLIISENTIRNIKNGQENAYGMIIGLNAVNTSITRNMISGIKYTGNGGYGGKGIDIYPSCTESNILVANNVVSDISGDGYDYLSGDAIVGIRVTGPTDGVDLYYNSVNLSGNIGGSYSDDLSAAIFINSSVTGIRMKNNIFRNSIADTANNAYAYSIVSFAPNSAFTGIDYNDYFAEGPQGVLGYLDNDVFTLSELQTATGQDDFSLNEDPLFISATDLHPQTGSPVLGAGVPITGITEDFSGDPRNSANPSMGAYENGAVSTNKTLNITLFLEGLYSGSGIMNQAYDDMGPHFGTGIADRVTIELHDGTTPFTTAYTYGDADLNTSGTLAITTLPASITGSYYIVIKHRNSIETWSTVPVSFAGGTVSYDFSSASSQAYGNNLKLMGTVYVIFGGDASQDGAVDGTDMALIDNASTAVLVGYNPEDVNGDGIVDGSDMAMVDNNSTAIVTSSKTLIN